MHGVVKSLSTTRNPQLATCNLRLRARTVQSGLSILMVVVIGSQALFPLSAYARSDSESSKAAKAARKTASAVRARALQQDNSVQAAQVNHAPAVSGRIEGVVRQLTGENVTLNGIAVITSALLVPGTPQVVLNGHASIGTTTQGTGSAQPSNYTVTLNSNASIGTLVTRTDPIPMPSVSPPPAPTGTQDVQINTQNPTINFTTLRDLTLNGNAGNVTVPPGTYRNFTANGKTAFVFGVSGATQPSVYNLTRLTINGGASLQVAGPVILTLGSDLVLDGSAGASTNPLLLTVNVASGNVTLNGGVSLFAVVQAPSSAVTINGNSLLQGSVTCDRLTVNGNSTLKGTPGALQSIGTTAGTQGQTITVTLHGDNTHWISGQTVASFGNGISVGGAASGAPGPVQVTDQATGTASLVISPTAALAPRTVTVTTPVAGLSEGETEVLIDAFTVTAVNAPGASSSQVSTIAGIGATPGFADGTGAQAQFNGLAGIAVGRDDTIYIADAGNNRIRAARNQSAAWTVSTVAGNGTAGFADGSAATAQFNSPRAIAVDSLGVLYVADTANNRIRKIETDGTVSTIAGSGTPGLVNSTGTAAQFNAPSGIAVDSLGNLYVADTGNSTVRFINPAGAVSSVAGDGTIGSNDSPSAHFNGLIGIAVDGATALIYLADTNNERIRRLDTHGTVITLAGVDQGFADGSASQARFAEPGGLAVDGTGRIIVADSTNSLIRQIDPTLVASGSQSAVTTLAGTGTRSLADGAGNVASFFMPAGVGVSLSSAVIVADTGNQVLRRIVLPPAIDSFNPVQAAVSTNITILGERFDARAPQNNIVNFTKAGGGQTQAQVLAATRSQLTVTVPSNAATGPVTVQTEGGTATSPVSFTVTSGAPVIADFNPKTGEVGSAVVITGTNLTTTTGPTTVTFTGNGGARIPALITFLSKTEADVIVPNGAMTGPIMVTTSAGQAVSAVSFTLSPGQQDYQLTVTPSVTSVVQGSSTNYVVYLTSPLSTFGQLASLTATGLPAGVTASFSPQQITAGARSTLNINLSGATLSPGSYSFTISGTALVNGAPLVRTATATLTVLAAGQTTLSGRVLSTDDQPILGATVFLDGKTATTDGSGGFLLAGVNAGVNRPLSIDGRTASAPNRTYPLITEPANIVAGQANQMPFIFYLPPIDTQFETSVNPNADTPVVNPRVPGLQITIPRGANLRNRDGSPVSTVSITPLPPDRTPAPLPSNVTAQIVYTSQPGGAIADIAMPVIYPNLAGLNPGTRVELYAFNHDTVQWYIYGYGDVSLDGKTIAPEVNPTTNRSYGLTDFSWHFPNCGQGGNPSPCDSCPVAITSNPVDLATGLKIERETDLSFGGARGGIALTRVYTTDLAQNCDACPFGRGWTHSYAAKLGGTFQQGGAGQVIMPGEVTGRLFSYAGTDPDGALVFMTTATVGQLGDKVRKLTDGTFQYRYKHGNLMLFDSTGHLVALQDRNGNRTVLTYSGSSLTQITDPVGRSVSLGYDSSGRITSATDPIGRTWKYTYEGTPGVAGAPGLTTVTDPLGFVQKYVYVTGGRILQVIDKRGNTVKTVSYDAAGHVATQQFADGGIETYRYTLSGGIVTSTTIIDPMGRMATLRFNSVGYVISLTDALGQTTTIQRDIVTSVPLVTAGPCGCPQLTRTFDGAGNVLTSTDSLGHSDSFQYDPVFNNVIRYTDKLNKVTNYSYDSNGNLSGMTRAAGTLNLTNTFGYDSFGELTSRVDPLGHTSRFQYDTSGNNTAEIDPLNDQMTFQYDGTGRRTSIIDALGRSSSIAYNALYPITVTDRAGAITRFDSDPNGDLIRITDAIQNQWTYTYDAKNRNTFVTDPLGHQATFNYDLDNEMTAVVSPSGRTRRYTYDARGQIITIQDPIGGLVNLAYDNRRNLISLADQRGNTTSYGYDELFRRVSSTDPFGSSSTVTYDPMSNVVDSVDRLGRHTRMTYDDVYRPTSITYADSTVTQIFDAASRLTGIDDTQGGSIRWTYDDADRTLSETTPAGVVSYAYNAADQRMSMTAADRPPVTYGYEPAGRLQTITQAAEIFTFSYDTVSRRSSLQRPNGVTTSYSYDPSYRLTRLTHNRAGAQPIEDFVFSYDLDDQIAAITSLASAGSLPPAITAGSADAANRIGQFATASFRFDAEGQTTSKTDSTGTARYQWDARGRLTQATLPGNQVVSYSYDALGRRASRSAAGVTTTFLYDGIDVVLDRGSDGSAVDYLNGTRTDEKLQQKSGAGLLYLLTDHLGSTAALTDATGNVTEREQYGPYGAAAASQLTRYGYTGRELDSTSGLMHYRARWYDPQQGRFLTEDPAGVRGGLNLYAYVGDYAVGYNDPLGLGGAGTATAPAPAPKLPPPVESPPVPRLPPVPEPPPIPPPVVIGPVATGLAICGAFLVGFGIGLAIGEIPTGGGRNVNDRAQDFFTRTIFAPSKSDAENERCQHVREECHRECWEDDKRVPKCKGQDTFLLLRKCTRECMEKEGCYNF